MTATRPHFRPTDALPTAGLFLLGVLVSFGLASATLILSHGFWILWPVILFLSVMQLIFEAGVGLIWRGLRRGWYALRGIAPPPERPLPPQKPEPWIKSYAFLFGFLMGGGAMLVSTWLSGGLSASGGPQ